MATANGSVSNIRFAQIIVTAIILPSMSEMEIYHQLTASAVYISGGKHSVDKKFKVAGGVGLCLAPYLVPEEPENSMKNPAYRQQRIQILRGDATYAGSGAN